MVALLRLLLMALFVFLVVTVAAFVYLEWWQAILVSFATFVMIIYAGKVMVRSAVTRLGNFASELFRVKSRVLKGATVDVHSVRAIDAPGAMAVAPDEDPEESADLGWYEIEVSIFPAPDAAGPMTHWDLDDLRLVPADTPDCEGLEERDDEDAEVIFDRLWLIQDGEAIAPEQPKFHGPQRLRIIAGFPRSVPVWKFRYYFEQFGRIDLPARTALR